jgi:hypothetical protein
VISARGRQGAPANRGSKEENEARIKTVFKEDAKMVPSQHVQKSSVVRTPPTTVQRARFEPSSSRTCPNCTRSQTGSDNRSMPAFAVIDFDSILKSNDVTTDPEK